MSWANSDQLRLPVPDHDHRVLGGAASFRGTSRVNDPDVRGPRDLRHVAVAVGDDITAGEELAHALVATDSRSAVVDEPDPKPLELGRRSHRKGRAKPGVVHVSVYRDYRAEALQVGEHGGRREVARVDDGVRGLEEPEAVRRKRTRAAREMRVSQKRDQKRSGRNSPLR
jgi:hypothetical protein